MKTVAVLIVLFVYSGLSAQDWRDTLKMARSAYEKEHYKKALKYYEQAQKGAPRSVDLSDEMAQSAYKAEDYQRAEKIYQQNQGSKSGKKSRSDNFHNLGNTRMKSENYEGAIEAYKEALRIDPADKETRYNLSEAKRKLKKQQDQQQQQQDQQNGGNNNQQQSDSGQQSGSDQNNQGQQNNSQQNSNQQSKGQQKSQGQGSQKKNGNNNSGRGQLSDKTADRMLEELMKKEAETKRRMSGGGGGGGSAKSGKDW